LEAAAAIATKRKPCASVLGADGRLLVESIEQVGEIVSVIKIEVDLWHIVH
jgi:hypothetical protein